MKLNGKITILIDRDRTLIKLHDNDSNITFAEITLSPEQLSSALSRLSHTECDKIELFGIDKLGKKMEHKRFEFELPREYMSSADYDELFKIAQKLLDKDNEGWICSDGFASQDSFYRVNGKPYARCTVRRWI